MCSELRESAPYLGGAAYEEMVPSVDEDSPPTLTTSAHHVGTPTTGNEDHSRKPRKSTTEGEAPQNTLKEDPTKKRRSGREGHDLLDEEELLEVADLQERLHWTMSEAHKVGKLSEIGLPPMAPPGAPPQRRFDAGPTSHNA